jgi:hypothetical protein
MRLGCEVEVGKLEGADDDANFGAYGASAEILGLSRLAA